MAHKKIYYVTEASKANHVVLVKSGVVGVVETFCVGKSAKNRKINEPKWNGFYFNSELKLEQS